MGDAPTVVLVVPITPAVTGNGLAMRAGMLLDALAPVAAVHVVVVPVSGAGGDLEWVRQRARSTSVVDPLDATAARDHAVRALADPDLRARLERTAPLPARAAVAPATLATAVAADLPDHVGAVLAMRLYLAPLGINLARRLGARVVIDADDDDAALLRALGDAETADGFERLAQCWLPDADAVLAASAPDATALAARAGVDQVHVVPNAVKVPASVPDPPGDDRLLFVGNLTYEPNVVAARALAVDVLPRVREVRPDATAVLVGGHGPPLAELVGVPGVELTGAVPEVTSEYARADVVVVPLRHGGGTRIKILEAFAHRRPVVATRAALTGLDIDHDEAVIADLPDELARATVALLNDTQRANAMTQRAFELVSARYTRDAVAPLVQRVVLQGGR